MTTRREFFEILGAGATAGALAPTYINAVLTNPTDRYEITANNLLLIWNDYKKTGMVSTMLVNSFYEGLVEHLSQYSVEDSVFAVALARTLSYDYAIPFYGCNNTGFINFYKKFGDLVVMSDDVSHLTIEEQYISNHIRRVLEQPGVHAEVLQGYLPNLPGPRLIKA